MLIVNTIDMLYNLNLHNFVLMLKATHNKIYRGKIIQRIKTFTKFRMLWQKLKKTIPISCYDLSIKKNLVRIGCNRGVYKSIVRIQKQRAVTSTWLDKTNHSPRIVLRNGAKTTLTRLKEFSPEIELLLNA